MACTLHFPCFRGPFSEARSGSLASSKYSVDRAKVFGRYGQNALLYCIKSLAFGVKVLGRFCLTAPLFGLKSSADFVRLLSCFG